MNGRELSGTSLGDAAREPSAQDSNDRELEREHFALAIAGCLQQSVLVPPPALGLGHAEASESVPAGWRPGVDALTPNADVLVNESSGNRAVESLQGETNDDSQRLQVRVKTKELGEIALIVERLDTGLRVRLGAVDSGALSQLKEQSAAVRQALESSGHSVDSLEIVRMDGFGIDLAQPRLALSHRARRSQGSEESGTTSGNNKKKKTKRLNLIG